MRAADIASGLDARKNGPGRWIARCPAHDDGNPSLSIADGDDGKPLVHCHGGCPQESVISVLRERGLWPNASPAVRRAAEHRAAQRSLEHAELIVALAEYDASHGRALSPEDRKTVRQAERDKKQAQRIVRPVAWPILPLDEFKRPRPHQWLIPKVIERNSLVSFIGAPEHGKSLAIQDCAACIASGKDWHGQPVRQAPVLYCAAEGQEGMRRRLTAWEIHHDVPIPSDYFSVAPTAADLLNPEMASAVRAAIDELPQPPGLVVLDTLAANFGPGDENSTQDMCRFISLCSAIREDIGAAMVIVHHTGHLDHTRGRGSSALKAALDIEYRVAKFADAPMIRLTCNKAKDFEKPPERDFHIVPVELQILEEDGSPVTSVVLERTEPPPDQTRPRRLSPKQRVALDALTEAIELHGEPPAREDIESSHIPLGVQRVVALERWREVAYARGISDGEDESARRHAFRRAREALQERGAVDCWSGVYWRTPPWG